MSYSCLKLENQLCFPIYALSHQITKIYKPFLDEIGLTYTQYITMMVLWDKNKVNVKDLSEALLLDSGTLTPLLKRLEKKELLTRTRSTIDERSVDIELTDKGRELEELAKDIPYKVGSCIPLDEEDGKVLYTLLYKAINGMK